MLIANSALFFAFCQLKQTRENFLALPDRVFCCVSNYEFEYDDIVWLLLCVRMVCFQRALLAAGLKRRAYPT